MTIQGMQAWCLLMVRGHSSRTIQFPADYDFVSDYPLILHSNKLCEDTSFQSYRKPTWNVFLHTCPKSGDTVGVMTSGCCMQSFLVQSGMDPNTTISGRTVCDECFSLLHHQPLVKTLETSAKRDYNKKLNDMFCPSSELIRRRREHFDKYQKLQLKSLNLTRRVGSLTKSCGDNHRFVVAITRNPPRPPSLPLHSWGLYENPSLPSEINGYELLDTVGTTDRFFFGTWW